MAASGFRVISFTFLMSVSTPQFSPSIMNNDCVLIDDEMFTKSRFCTCTVARVVPSNVTNAWHSTPSIHIKKPSLVCEAASEKRIQYKYYYNTNFDCTQHQTEKKPCFPSNKECMKTQNMDSTMFIFVDKETVLTDVNGSVLSEKRTISEPRHTCLDICLYNKRIALALMNAYRIDREYARSFIGMLKNATVVDTVTINSDTEITKRKSDYSFWFVTFSQVSLWIIAINDAIHLQHRFVIVDTIQRLHGFRRVIKRYATIV
jgi:hypothetical protein